MPASATTAAPATQGAAAPSRRRQSSASLGGQQLHASGWHVGGCACRCAYVRVRVWVAAGARCAPHPPPQSPAGGLAALGAVGGNVNAGRVSFGGGTDVDVGARGGAAACPTAAAATCACWGGGSHARTRAGASPRLPSHVRKMAPAFRPVGPTSPWPLPPSPRPLPSWGACAHLLARRGGAPAPQSSGAVPLRPRPRAAPLRLPCPPSLPGV